MNGTSLHVLPFHVTPNDPRSPLFVAPWLREPFLEVGGIEDNGAIADWRTRPSELGVRDSFFNHWPDWPFRLWKRQLL